MGDVLKKLYFHIFAYLCVKTPFFGKTIMIGPSYHTTWLLKFNRSRLQNWFPAPVVSDDAPMMIMTICVIMGGKLTLAREIGFYILKKGKSSEFHQKDIWHDKTTPLRIINGSKRLRHFLRA